MKRLPGLSRLLGAIHFLTVLPIPGDGAAPGDSAAFFPLVGALLGASLGALLGVGLPPLLALAALVAITGCLHEDGLADVADALRVGRTREKMMGILKDSRIGTYGGLALVFSVAIRWQALSRIAYHPVIGLAAALALSRASLVVLAGIAPAAGQGLGAEFSRSCSRRVLAIAIVQAVATAALAGPRRGIAMVAATALLLVAARAYFVRRLGGVNGDCLGATCQAVETLNLTILAWHPFI